MHTLDIRFQEIVNFMKQLMNIRLVLDVFMI